MRILKMRASFGKLHDELTLDAGFNCLCLPNEAGKSTWSAFLVAMLYGIDTSERAGAANQGLPAKERYKPWDGSAMEGAIELLWNGRHITIERTTKGRVPMGVFRAFESDSGTSIPELTAENCGSTLCGVGRSVFERTAFIRQLGLTVTGDAALEQRLNALVSTGEEGAKSYSELEKELRAIKNRLSGRAGRIPKLAERAQTIEKTLTELRAMQNEALAFTAQSSEAAKEVSRLEALQARITRAQNAEKRIAYGEAAQKLQAQELLCRKLRETVETLPVEQELHTLRRELDTAESALQTARMEAAFYVAEVSKPAVPQCFEGMDAETAREKVHSDALECQKLRAVKAANAVPLLLLAALLLLAGVGLCFVLLPLGLALSGIGAVLLCVLYAYTARRKTRARESAHCAELILSRYGVENVEELDALSSRYTEALQSYDAKCAEAEAKKQALQKAVQDAATQVDALIAKTARFAPDCRTAADCREAITAALRAHEHLLGENRVLEGLRRQFHSMRFLLDETEDAEEDAEALTLDEAKISYELRGTLEKYNDLTTRLAALRGAISAKGDPIALEAESERLREAIAQANEQLNAVELALTALQKADEALRSRFAPQITAEAGTILSALTEGKYPRLLLAPDMRLSVREETGTIMRPAAAMSCGTADQMYLALRLAMCHKLLPDDAPLILDDALVNFDDARAAAALRLLREEAKKRQVLLFTCRQFDANSLSYYFHTN